MLIEKPNTHYTSYKDLSTVKYTKNNKNSKIKKKTYNNCKERNEKKKSMYIIFNCFNFH